ncbi:MAG: helix-turn-helix domain-containing protein [Gammaproteobacteria bacterium]|nr:helix-turn-helix domain-containing protein [Gammaproteobacteria bacterium]
MTNEQPTIPPTKGFGLYLKALREGKKMSLRGVEEATGKDVSNAYLSQLENGKIAKPSPHILHTLSEVYGVEYSKLMERVGYISPSPEKNQSKKHGRAATFAIDNLTQDEENELLEYLSFIRKKRK